MILPNITGTRSQNFGGTNVMVCVRYRSPRQLSNITQIGFAMASGTTGTCGIGVWHDSDSGIPLWSGSTTCPDTTNTSATHEVNIHTGSNNPVRFNADTTYRICICDSVNSSYVGVTESAGGQMANLLNSISGITMIGTATNGCTAGVPPTNSSGTGAIVPDVTRSIPIVSVGQIN